MKFEELIDESDFAVKILDMALTAMVKCGWTTEQIVLYVNDVLELKIEEKASS